MHGCMDGYYKLDESTTKTKLKSLTKVMKGALSVSKSKTGEIICRDNRIEREQLKPKLIQLNREKNFACVENEHMKRLFSRKHKSSLHLSLRDPPTITYLKNRYKKLRETIREKSMTMDLLPHSKFKGQLLESEGVEDKDDEDDIADKSKTLRLATKRVYHKGYKEIKEEDKVIEDSTETGHKRENSIQRRQGVDRKVNAHLLTKTELDLIREARIENIRKQLADAPVATTEKTGADMWREKTFDMSGIQDLLALQKERQEKMVIKIKLERFHTQKEIKRRLTEEKYSSGLDHVGRVYTPSSAGSLRVSKKVKEIPSSCARFVGNHGGYGDVQPTSIMKKRSTTYAPLPPVQMRPEIDIEVQTQDRALKSRSVSFVRGT